MALPDNRNGREMDKFVEDTGVVGIRAVFVSSAGYTSANAAARPLPDLEFRKFTTDDDGNTVIRVIET